MTLTFDRLHLPKEGPKLAQFLASEPWPFHVNAQLTEARVLEMVADGKFGGPDQESFWITVAGEHLGVLRILDLDDVDDGYPLFDLRLKPSAQGRGVGRATVEWLARYLFEKFPHLDRIAGTTRADNIAMRRVFCACGFAKEGHFRDDWAGADGQLYATVKYGLLRKDWLRGETTPVPWEDEP